MIIDDEQHCIDRLAMLLETQCGDTVHIMDAFTNAADAGRAIQKYKPDLVFLDIQLGETTAFDLLRDVGEVNFEIVFTTAYDKYAARAFRFSALDYLLKPIDAEDLKQAVNRHLKKNASIQTTQKLEVLLGNLYSDSKRICVPVANGLLVLKVEDIIRCHAEINYTVIHMRDKQKITVARTIREFEEMLSDHHFFRVHNSDLVNLDEVKAYNRGRGGYVKLKDNTEIEVSVRRKAEFLIRLQR